MILEWASAESMDHIEKRLERSFVLAGNHRGGRNPARSIMNYDATDIASLGQQLCYLLYAAGDLLVDEPEHRRELRALAERCASGVPPIPAALLRLGVPGLSREVVLPLAFIDDPPKDLEHLLDHLALPPDVRQATLRQLHLAREQEYAERWSLPADVAEAEMPSTTATYGQALEQLRGADSIEKACDVLCTVFGLHGITAVPGPGADGACVLDMTDGVREVRIGVAHGLLDQELLTGELADADLIVALGDIDFVTLMRYGEGQIRHAADLAEALHYQQLNLQVDSVLGDVMLQAIMQPPPG
jgi:hypothetical protein